MSNAERKPYRLLAERRARARAGDTVPVNVATARRGEDLLGLLLPLRDEDGSQCSGDGMRDKVLMLIFSGHKIWTLLAMVDTFGCSRFDEAGLLERHAAVMVR